MPYSKEDEEAYKRELDEAIARVAASSHPKRIVVAGPGAGKTSLFKKLLKQSKDANSEARHLVVTFINALAHELKRDLSDLSYVSTFHGFCKQVLHQQPRFRGGLTENFGLFPKLPSIIKNDWMLLMEAEDAPEFVKRMREARDDDEIGFYMDRATHYDAAAFDDIVFRVYATLKKYPDAAPQHELILVDEYQDFNLLEISLIDALSRKSAIVVAGDDDQVLYGAFRNSDWSFIRECYASQDYEPHGLPFCLRCPEVIVNAFDDVIREATKNGYLKKRIAKDYRYFPPVKMSDSTNHPKIIVLKTSIQKKTGGNYFGKAVEYVAKGIPPDHIKASREGGYPTILVIGNKQYLQQISVYLKDAGYVLDERSDTDGQNDKVKRNDALEILKASPDSTLGWRIMLEVDNPSFFRKSAKQILRAKPLVEALPADYREKVIEEVEKYTLPAAIPPPAVPDIDKPTIKLTSYQGAKGLSAQYVFIAGLHDGDLPRKESSITDIEICKLLVALTRTRKQCFILWTLNFGGVKKSPSSFLRWIGAERKTSKYIDAKFWKTIEKAQPKG
jgi:superfamily I DNA/RNA helicase